MYAGFKVIEVVLTNVTGVEMFALQGGPLKTTVTGVEMFKKILDNGQVND